MEPATDFPRVEVAAGTSSTPSVALVRRSPLEQVRELATYLDDLEVVATTLCKATILPKAMQSPANLKLVLMQGLAMGFDVIQSIRASFIIEKEGETPKVGYYVDSLVALVRQSSVCRYFRVEESSSKRCRVVCARTDEPEDMFHVYELTLEQARESGLDKKWFRGRGGEWISEVKYNWQSNPADMLNARTCGRAVKRTFQDVVFGMVTPDELEDIVLADRDRDRDRNDFVPVQIVPRSAPTSSSSATSPATASEPVVVRDDVVDAELVHDGTGDDEWDDFMRLVSALIGEDTQGWMPDEFTAKWDALLALATTRQRLTTFTPLIGHAASRAERSKACATAAAHMKTSFTERNAKLRELEKGPKP